MPFRRLLESLVARAPGARGAIFCDHEGESVDLVLSDDALSEYDMKVFGAQLAAAWLSLQNDSAERGAGAMVELRIGCADGTLLTRSLPEGYYVVLLIRRGAPSAVASYQLAATAAAMAAEI